MTDGQKVPEQASNFPTGLSQPARRALRAAGFTSLEELRTVRAADLLRLHGMGPKALAQLRAALAERGLALADEDGKNDPSR
ncbi:DNA-binding protein [Deinococcus aerius]|nr:DNA-binding protein [Deinococcus aerius]